MKPGWKTVKVGDVCSLLTGGTPSRQHDEYFGGSIRWLVSGDINQKEIYDCEGRITQLGIDNSNARLLPKDSVMIALAGQGKTRGTVAMLRVEAACNQSMVCMHPLDHDQLMPEFLYYNLQGRYQEIRRLTGDDGNDRRGLNMGIISDIEIPLPPLAEQKRIVALLDEAFAGIDKAKANAEISNKLLADFLTATTAECFAGGEDWAEMTLGDICHVYQPQTLSQKELIPGPYTVYGANGPIGTHNAFNHEDSELTLGCRGSCGSVHHTSGKSWINGNAMVVRPKEQLVSKEFLSYALRGGVDITSAITGTAQPQITRKSLMPIRIAVPPLSQQGKIVSKLDEVLNSVTVGRRLYVEQAGSFDSLKSSLLSKAFVGELAA